MPALQLAGTLLTAAEDTRTLTYRLLPFGEPGHTSSGLITAAKGAVTLPDGPVVANLEHDPTRPIAWLTASETDEEIMATVKVAQTTAGDDLLVEAREGLRTGISVEISDSVIRAGRLISGALTGAGFVTSPAFPSAQLIAADAGDLPDTLEVNGATYVRQDATPTPDDTASPDSAAPAAGSENTVTAPVTAATAPAAAPEGLTASTLTKAAKPRDIDEAAGLLAAAFKAGGDRALTAALVDITHDDGDNDGDGLGEITATPDWLGQVWEDAPYERIYIPLITGGTLTNWSASGYRFTTKPTVAKYTGNKAAVPSTGLAAERVSYGVQRWANAADIDRRYVDFSDQEIIAAFIRANVESYKEVTDLDTLAELLAAADAVVPGTVPVGVNPAVAAVADGALALLADHLRPSAAIVGADLYRDILLTPKDKITEFLSESFGLEGGSTAGFRIVPSAETDMLSQVVVLDGRTVQLREFGGGTPVRVQAENIGNAGVDVAVFGYTSFRVLRDGGVRQLDLGA